MRPFRVNPALCVRGEVSPAGDKSISHRSIIIASITRGTTTIENFPVSNDCLRTISAFKKLGIDIQFVPDSAKNCLTVKVRGKGRYGLNRPKGPIFSGDSGTTLRLILGVLCGQDFSVKLTAGKSLSRRPMLRVTSPLRMMGAKIIARRITHNSRQEEYPPIQIKGSPLHGITYNIPVASAQVKSAILLAGLYAKGVSRVIEHVRTRDHTERMLKLFKAGIKLKQNEIVIEGRHELISPSRLYVPGDISSASFFMVLASILPGSRVLIKRISLNPSRTGIIRILKRMGADICMSETKTQLSGFEPMGDICVKSSALKGTIVKEREIPSLIDELPVLIVAACFAKGRTIFEGVKELRVKETDRIKSMSENLIKMGAVINILQSDGAEHVCIQGIKGLIGRRVKAFADHRTAMSLVVAGLKAQGQTVIDDISCIDKSFPDFPVILKKLIQ